MEPTAKNVPKIRSAVLRRISLAHRSWSHFPVGRFEGYTDEARSEVLKAEMDGLTQATNLWVSPEWVDHLDEFRRVLNPDDMLLTTDGLFSHHGFVVYPRPITLSSVDSDSRFSFSGMLWTVNEIMSEHGPRMGISTTSYIYRQHYRLHDEGIKLIDPTTGEPYLIVPPGRPVVEPDMIVDESWARGEKLPEHEPWAVDKDGNRLTGIEVRHLWDAVMDTQFEGEEWLGVGRNDWFFDTVASDMTDSMTVKVSEDKGQAIRHITEDRTLFWVLNQLLTAERHTERTVRKSTAKKKSKGRKRTVGNDEVIIVHLRKNAPSKPTLNPGTGRKLEHESKTQGHYRNQPYGPGRKLVKRIWIDEFKRGEGLPPKEQVYSLDR
jgi:hypothetical protein